MKLRGFRVGAPHPQLGGGCPHVPGVGTPTMSASGLELGGGGGFLEALQGCFPEFLRAAWGLQRAQATPRVAQGFRVCQGS